MSKKSDKATSKHTNLAEDVLCLGDWTQQYGAFDTVRHQSSTNMENHGPKSSRNGQEHFEAMPGTGSSIQTHGGTVEGSTMDKSFDKLAHTTCSVASGLEGRLKQSNAGEPNPIKRLLHTESKEDPWHPGRYDEGRRCVTDNVHYAAGNVKHQKWKRTGSGLE